MERARDRVRAATRQRGVLARSIGAHPRNGTAITAARAAALVLLTTAMLAACATSASAVIVRLANGKSVSYQPLRGVAAQSFLQPFAPSGNLVYHGGPVMTSNTNYTFYWAPSGSPAYPSGYQAGVDRYLEDLAHDSGGNQN